MIKIIICSQYEYEYVVNCHVSTSTISSSSSCLFHSRSTLYQIRGCARAANTPPQLRVLHQVRPVWPQPKYHWSHSHLFRLVIFTLGSIIYIAERILGVLKRLVANRLSTANSERNLFSCLGEPVCFALPCPHVLCVD